jgi:hypothetical protein
MQDVAIATTRPGTLRHSVAGIVACALVAVLLFVAGWSVIALLTRDHHSHPKGSIPVNPAIEEQFGVRVSRVAAIADGGLVDVRFIVLDPDKALTTMEELSRVPLLIDEESGALVRSAALMNPTHDLAPGRTSYMLYRNTRGVIENGDLVTLKFGDLRLEHVRAG